VTADALLAMLVEKIADAVAERLAVARTPGSDPDEVVKVAVAAKRYSVTPAWLRGEIRTGRLVALRAGRHLRVRLADVEVLMQGQDDELARRRGRGR
jgi:hypothetical protein